MGGGGGGGSSHGILAGIGEILETHNPKTMKKKGQTKKGEKNMKEKRERDTHTHHIHEHLFHITRSKSCESKKSTSFSLMCIPNDHLRNVLLRQCRTGATQ